MSDTPTLLIKVLPHGENLTLPAYQSAGAAGMDLVAALHAPDEMTIAPQARAMVPTGLIFSIPDGFEGQVRPRSGLAAKQGLTVLNAPGTIDSDYRGEVKVLLINHGTEAVALRRGDRIAQLVCAPVTRMKIKVKDILQNTERGEGGFGSTGD